jgi:hypothetical protein
MISRTTNLRDIDRLVGMELPTMFFFLTIAVRFCKGEERETETNHPANN